MGDVIQTQPIDPRDVDLKWMVGQMLSQITLHDPDVWVLSLSGGGKVTTQSTWRLLKKGRVVVSSSDHGHQFGLPQPVDVRKALLDEVGSSRILDARIDDASPDLVVRLENGVVLQIVATSLGYEAWQSSKPSGLHVVMNGGRCASSWTDAKVT